MAKAEDKVTHFTQEISEFRQNHDLISVNYQMTLSLPNDIFEIGKLEYLNEPVETRSIVISFKNKDTGAISELCADLSNVIWKIKSNEKV